MVGKVGLQEGRALESRPPPSGLGLSAARLPPGTYRPPSAALHPVCPGAAQSESCPGLKKEIFINNLNNNNNAVDLNGHTWEAYRTVRKEAGLAEAGAGRAQRRGEGQLGALYTE